MEKTEVYAQIMRDTAFRDRVRAICAIKAYAILGEATPDAQELAWAKLAVGAGYDAWMEALLMLVEAAPATPEAAYNAGDSVYATTLASVLPEVIKAKGL